LQLTVIKIFAKALSYCTCTQKPGSLHGAAVSVQKTVCKVSLVISGVLAYNHSQTAVVGKCCKSSYNSCDLECCGWNHGSPTEENSNYYYTAKAA